MTYVETLLAEYRLELWYVVCALPLSVGLALLEARAVRLAPGPGAGWAERYILDARETAERELRQSHRIIPNPPRKEAARG